MEIEIIMEYIIEHIDGNMIKCPRVLYKYRTWNDANHKKVLNENSLYMASPRKFDDIKDCRVPQKFPSQEELRDYFTTKDKFENPYRSRGERRELVRRLVKESPLSNPRKLAERLGQIKEEFNDCFGVLSMTANPSNDEMWKQYSYNHRGICVGFDTKSLFESMNGGGGEVQYTDELPIIDLLKDNLLEKHIKNVYFKERKWEFEEEYRLHKMWKHKASDDERNIQLPDNCITEIHIGKFVDPKDKTEILKIAKEKYPKAKIIEHKE